MGLFVLFRLSIALAKKVIMTPQELAQSKTIAEAFTTHYYQCFDADRSVLANLYCDVSLLQFESEQVIMGKDEIIKKLVGLPMRSVKHIVTTVDGQPTIDGGIMIHVLGQLKTDEDQPHSFTETFHLKKDPSGASYLILNEVFRLGVHNG